MALAANLQRIDPVRRRSTRILIVDDSVVARAVIARTLDVHLHYEVVGAVADATSALAFLAANQVDIILLDIEMPGIDGLSALPDLIAAGDGAKILVVSSSCDDGAAATIQALTLGAADTLVKPSVGQLAGKFAKILDEKIARLIDPDNPVSPTVPMPAPGLALANDFDVVAIGASTGGIHAVGQLLRTLPASFKLPILITQHLPGSFMPYFAAQLTVLGDRPCDVAADHMRIRPGRMIVAPGDAHIRCVKMGDDVGIRLVTDPAASGCLPSVDPMLASVAQIYGSRAFAVMLSGMGRDGTEGAKAVYQAGGYVVVQDKGSSVVWGMPGSVVQCGMAHAILPPHEIGRLIVTQRRPSC